MRPLFALFLVLTVAPAAAADLADVDTYLGETVFDEVQVSPDGARLAFITRRNDFARDREAFALWTLDLSRPAGSLNSASPARASMPGLEKQRRVNPTPPSGGVFGLARALMPGREDVRLNLSHSRPVRLADTGTYSALRWSPDGRLLSFLNAADGEAAQLFVLPPASGAAPRRVTDPARFADGVDLYDWLPDGSGLIFVAAEPGDETAEARRKRQEFYGDVRRRAGPPAKSALYRVALADGKADRIDAMPFDVPVALAISPDGWWLAVLGYMAAETADTNEVFLLPLGPQAVGPQRTRNRIWEESLAWAGKDLFVAGEGEEKDGRFTNTEGRLFRLEGSSRLARVSPGLEGYVKQLVPLPDGGLLVTANVSTHMRVSRVEPGSGTVRTLLDQPGWIANLSASRDGGTIAFGTSDPRHYPEIYVAQGVDGLARARPVTDFNASFTRGPLPETETVSWDDGEGGTVEGVLFWPPGRKGEKGLPLVVDLHGGPFSVARTEAVSLQGSFLSFPGLLAARGFLVLNPNSRGSAGRGDAFVQGIEGRRCSRPSQDVILGVESLIARGWADRERLAVMGYSAGGGLSKCLIGRTDLFRAAATGAGVWNDIAVYGTRRGLMWAESFQRGQPPWEDFARWWSESPASRLDRVKTPTLILAGERDGEAPSQAEELYRGLLARGVPAELLIFPGEGHIFSKPSHKRTKMRAELSWLEHYVLGKPRPELP